MVGWKLPRGSVSLLCSWAYRPTSSQLFAAKRVRVFMSTAVVPPLSHSAPPLFQKDFSSLVLTPHDDPQQQQQLVAAFQHQNQVKIKGGPPGVVLPAPILQFEHVNFGESVMRQLAETFPKPTPIQSQSWPIILQGHDCIVLARTGSGKTLAYALPAVVHLQAQPQTAPLEGPVVLVVAPTRELAVQISSEFLKFAAAASITVALAYGGKDGAANRTRQARELSRGGLDVLVCTPGRLVDFLQAQVVSLRRVSMVVLDEADRLLDMGFAPQLREILSQTRSGRQTLLFSATWAPKVKALVSEFTQDPIQVSLDNAEHLQANADIEQVVVDVAEHRGSSSSPKLALLQQWVRKVQQELFPQAPRVLVFVNTKVQVERVGAALRNTGKAGSTYMLHGDISQNQREQALRGLKESSHAILVATDVASRGLDIKDLPCVINFDLPTDVDQYIHRIGRTGRAGQPGLAVSFFDAGVDAAVAPALARVIQTAGQTPPPFLLKRYPSSEHQGQQQQQRKRYQAPRGTWRRNSTPISSTPVWDHRRS